MSTVTSVALLFALPTVRARADAYVSVSAGGFSPGSVTIAPGEAVIWVVADDMGPYTISSPTGAWGPRYLYDLGDSDGLQFNQVNDYPYYDAFSGHSGIVYVRDAVPNIPPSVTITSPANGAVFNAPAAFTFASEASDPDDGLMEVDFYVGSDLVEELFAGPFAVAVTNLAAGSYTLMAVAYDYALAATTNAISITVQARPGAAITLGSPQLVGGQFQFTVAGLAAGKTVVLQSSAALGLSAGWTALETKVANTGPTTFTTSVLPGIRFFRVMQAP